MTEQQGFPLPSQIADVPGAENWRSMYQYFTRFQPDDDKRFWFYNSMHFPEPIPAFDSVTSEIPYQAIGAVLAPIAWYGISPVIVSKAGIGSGKCMEL